VTEPAVSKAAFLRHVLETENALIHIDPRKQRVAVPEALKSEKHTVLLLGFRLAIPIRDLTISDVGFSATLSFNRTPFLVFVPWDAVLGVVGHSTTQFRLWPDAFSEDLIAEMAKEQEAAGKKKHAPVLPSRTSVTKRPNPAGLRLVKSDE
jgi:hypothetical protein